MKKLLALLLSLTLILTSFAACGSNDDADTDTTNPGTNAGEQLPEDETQDEDTAGEEQEETTPKEDVADNEKEEADKEGEKEPAKEPTQKPAQKPSDKNESNSVSSSSKPSKNEGTSESKPAKAPKGTPSEIINKIYEKKAVDIPVGTMDLDLSDKDAVKRATGISNVSKIKAASFSEAMIGSQAYSLVVVRANAKKDVESLTEEMVNGIDQRKWICVEADDLRVAALDDLIMLIMVDSQLSDIVTSKEMVNAFKAVCGGLDVSIS